MLKKFKAPLTLLIAGVLLLPGLVLAVGAKVDSSKADYLFTQQILFVDIRSSSDWDAGRVAGAEHLDVNKMSEEGLADLVEKDEVFIVYGNDSGDKRVSDAVSKAASWASPKFIFTQMVLLTGRNAVSPSNKSYVAYNDIMLVGTW